MGLEAGMPVSVTIPGSEAAGAVTLQISGIGILDMFVGGVGVAASVN